MGRKRPSILKPGGSDKNKAALLALLALPVVLGCALRGVPQQVRYPNASCTKNHLAVAGSAYENAKSFFADHFKMRNDLFLRYAYASSRDSSLLVSAIRDCMDYDPYYYGNEARELLRSNRILRVLVRNTMRDLDAQAAIGIFGEEYQDIFKNDIR